MKVNAKLKNLRVSPRKVRLTTELIKGMEVGDAIDQISANIKRANEPIIKLIKSAVASAENDFGLDASNLYISDIRVDAGITLKRWMPRAYGRATQILKRSSCVKLTLNEIVEGKNRKSKQQIDKEKKAREKSVKIAEKEITEGKKELSERVEEKKESILTDVKKEHHEVEAKRKESRQSGWTNKIFRRKSS
ncbi:MAG: 50S ribosomal protein L22 [Candidatus Moranbacteria bacterium GW2011_GWE2_35_2-]|nr:MAG: 50S ribosomal protein L22 [Candidatus Moranbacteria bacterium GW2011_GWE2_35_2-]KKQ04923.1 MAG: 50S ribosomal protein L22 [Candidatus Moranbacteria bacterium GW2011_GWF1_36_4]KKQ22927.1 MAG: 50S ribosomal protein L22 [Candidatus Moranbacteria bacterium GW2011_GWF2_37_11]KKQ29285.1 MAG: 50S ribosomal protein L22 [Candidatus Moranbacteria bacterium GW2011_GWD1_37_17]KKQ30842.1 MAG: 50S ribosomal protein L22 [Candidatus Moranbacteria bacterium GW2011_GWE1_37_24]KKQ47955.1 MAG: 50S ribosom